MKNEMFQFAIAMLGTSSLQSFYRCAELCNVVSIFTIGRPEFFPVSEAPAI